MDTDAFVRWALDDARTIEERYTTELMVERGVAAWNTRHHVCEPQSIDARMERKRQRALNPAYEPRYTATSAAAVAAAGLAAEEDSATRGCGPHARRA